MNTLPADAVQRLIARDGSLFSDHPGVAAEAASFMGWTRLARDAEAELPAFENLAEQVRADGFDDLVLLGMGGSSLAPLVLARTLAGVSGPRVTVLDTTSPVTVARTLEATDPARTIHVVSSKSGSTVEPNALYAIFRARADKALGTEEAGKRFIAVTDPGSSLEALAATDGMLACIPAPPDVGGRYSALTAFGLVPSALAGIDIRRLVAAARTAEDAIADGRLDLSIGRMMHQAHAAGADKMTLVTPPALRAFGLWVEQLVAESLGKHGMGVVPVIELGATEVADNELMVAFSRNGRTAGVDPAFVIHRELSDPYDIAAWFVEWEYSTALAGAALGLNPFDQPNVTEAKEATAAVLAGDARSAEPDFSVDGIELTFAGALDKPEHPERSLTASLLHALQAVHDGDYLALLLFAPDDPLLLDPLARAVAAASEATGIAICLELGPRYLHSTGQLHKGGPNTGVFVVITAQQGTDIPVPDRPWSLAELHCAQADGDTATLAAHGRRVLRIEMPGTSVSDAQNIAGALMQAAGSLGPVFRP